MRRARRFSPPRSSRLRHASVILLLSLTQIPGMAVAAGKMQPTTGPHGGPVWDLVTGPDDDLFALSFGIFRSHDGGNTWSAVMPVPATGLATSSGGPVFAFGVDGDPSVRAVDSNCATSASAP